VEGRVADPVTGFQSRSGLKKGAKYLDIERWLTQNAAKRETGFLIK